MVDADVIVVGAGLAGLVATAELAEAGRRVLLLDQEPAASLGGQAHWSLGGLLLVDSPEQRRMGIKDSAELAWQDWLGAAGFDRDVDDPAGEDYWASRWARAYVDFAAGEKRAWLHAQGVRWVPIVGWAERGGHLAEGHGNSVPRFHLTWGTGPGVVAPFARRVRAAVAAGRVELRFRHRVDEVLATDGVVDGVRGGVLEPSTAARGTRSSRVEVGEFALHAPAVLVTSGGIGADHDLVRAAWPQRLGTGAAAEFGIDPRLGYDVMAVQHRAGERRQAQDPVRAIDPVRLVREAGGQRRNAGDAIRRRQHGAQGVAEPIEIARHYAARPDCLRSAGLFMLVRPSYRAARRGRPAAQPCRHARARRRASRRRRMGHRHRCCCDDWRATDRLRR